MLLLFYIKLKQLSFNIITFLINSFKNNNYKIKIKKALYI